MRTLTKFLQITLLALFLAANPIFADKPAETVATKYSTEETHHEKQGQNIFSTKCIECHKSKTIVNYNEKKWIRIIDEMSEKSKLSVEEKLKLTKYILSYRQEKTIVNSN